MPAAAALGPSTHTRPLTLNEEEWHSVRVSDEEDGSIVLDCDTGEVFGPTAAVLGTIADGPRMWADAVTEDPASAPSRSGSCPTSRRTRTRSTSTRCSSRSWGREPIHGGTSVAGSNDPLAGETGFKDTVIAYPGEITRVKARYDLPGFYVWHCHILEHEDNEMMRPFHVGPIPPDAPQQYAACRHSGSHAAGPERVSGEQAQAWTSSG